MAAHARRAQDCNVPANGAAFTKCSNPPGQSCVSTGGACGANSPLASGRHTSVPPFAGGGYAPGAQGPSTEAARPFAAHEATDRPTVGISEFTVLNWGPGRVPVFHNAYIRPRRPDGNRRGDWEISSSDGYLFCYQLAASARTVGCAKWHPVLNRDPWHVCAKDRWIVRGRRDWPAEDVPT